MTQTDPATQKKIWEDLWSEVQTTRRALESGSHGQVSDHRRKELEDAYQVAHRAWWDSVSNYKP